MTNELYHHGVIGMKWGVRRYQNRDGTLTAEGRDRYGSYGLSIAKGAGKSRALTRKGVAKQVIKSNKLVNKQRSKELAEAERSYKKDLRATNRQFGKDSAESHDLYAKHEERKQEIQEAYYEGQRAADQFFKDRYGDQSFENALAYIQKHPRLVAEVDRTAFQRLGDVAFGAMVGGAVLGGISK